ncbi:unnamed protein product [Oncorhynchus mykiss]|uniref:Transposase Tc1-like domain-containing protein n=1 Tax=Oncorhynchus mykiss TaxID=8022 RepID=A0A060WPB3_ONCMY|nr:unnamed protein product [Oncorhynchus mykiss]
MFNVLALFKFRFECRMMEDQATEASSNRHISTSTVPRRLCESGIHGQIAAKKPLLKDTNHKKRLAWAKKHKQWALERWKSVLMVCFALSWDYHLFFNRTMTQHTSRLCKGYLTKHESDGVLHQMTCPPQSPDLNPIEMVWDELYR